MEPRHNMYRNVHKAFRRELAHLVCDVGATDAGCTADVAEIVSTWKRTRNLLEAHHHHEDTFIGPHLRVLVPSLFAELEREHMLLDREVAALTVHAEAALAARGTDRTYGFRTFYMGLVAFVARYFVHMDREEGPYLAALQEAYSDEELVRIEGDLVANIDPALMGSFLSVMLPAMNLDEREELLLGIRASAPPPVFEGTCELARSVLAESAWATLRLRLSISSTTDDAPITTPSRSLISEAMHA